MNGTFYPVILRAALTVAAIVATMVASATAESFYISSLLQGKAYITPMTLTFAVPYAIIVMISALGVAAVSSINTGGSIDEARTIVAALMSCLACYVISGMLSNNEYFLYSSDGSRAISANKSIMLAVSVACSMGI